MLEWLFNTVTLLALIGSVEKTSGAYGAKNQNFTSSLFVSLVSILLSF